jgi:hypothetical protein
VAYVLGVVAQQALDDGEGLRGHEHRRAEGAVGVLVDGLEDRLTVAEMLHVLGDDVDVVAIRMQRGDVALGALLSVVAVVVVRGDGRHLMLAEDAHETTRHGRLSCRRVADDAEHDGARHGSS